MSVSASTSMDWLDESQRMSYRLSQSPSGSQFQRLSQWLSKTGTRSASKRSRRSGKAELSDLLHRRQSSAILLDAAAEAEAEAVAAVVAAERVRLAEERPKYIRVWGSWDKVHPASGGVQSQQDLFTATRYDPCTHHPAMYATDDTVITEEMRRERGMDVDLSSNALYEMDKDHSQEALRSSDPFSAQFFIVEDMKELAGQDPRLAKDKVTLLTSPEPFDLLTERYGTSGDTRRTAP
jgi:hypothetical protein